MLDTKGVSFSDCRDPLVLTHIADLLYTNGNATDAAELYERVGSRVWSGHRVPEEDDPTLSDVRGRAYLVCAHESRYATGFADGLGYATKAVRLMPASTFAHQQYAQLLLLSGRHMEAIDEYDHALRLARDTETRNSILADPQREDALMWNTHSTVSLSATGTKVTQKDTYGPIDPKHSYFHGDTKPQIRDVSPSPNTRGG